MTLRAAPEPYVDRKTMAAVLGVSLSTLDRLVSEGAVPSCTWGLRSRRFRVSVVLAALEQRDEQRKAA